MNGMQPGCQTADCSNRATELLQSRKNSLELHLCEDCASSYNELGWKVVSGSVTLEGEP